MKERKIFRLAAPFLLGGMLLTSACSQELKSSSDIKVEAQNFKFNPKNLMVEPHKSILITLINKDVTLHDFVIDELGVHIHAEPKTSSEGSFIAHQEGEYEIFCSIPGHRQAGMVGKLIVRA